MIAYNARQLCRKGNIAKTWSYKGHIYILENRENDPKRITTIDDLITPDMTD